MLMFYELTTYIVLRGYRSVAGAGVLGISVFFGSFPQENWQYSVRNVLFMFAYFGFFLLRLIDFRRENSCPPFPLTKPLLCEHILLARNSLGHKFDEPHRRTIRRRKLNIGSQHAPLPKFFPGVETKFF